jgi:hypothetical protein
MQVKDRKRALAELREAELVREQRAQAFQQANAQFKKVKLHWLAVSTRGAL